MALSLATQPRRNAKSERSGALLGMGWKHPGPWRDQKEHKALLTNQDLGDTHVFTPAGLHALGPPALRPYTELPSTLRGAEQSPGLSCPPRPGAQEQNTTSRSGHRLRSSSNAGRRACCGCPVACAAAAFSSWAGGGSCFSPPPRPAGPARSWRGYRDRAPRGSSRLSPRASLMRPTG